MSSYNTLDPNNVAGLTPAQIAHKQALYDKYRHQEYVSTGVNGAPMNFFGLGDVNPDTLASAMLLTFGSGIGSELMGGVGGAAESGTSMFSPEAAGGYQSFTSPSSLTGVSAAPEIGSSGLLSSAGVTAGTSPYAITGTAGGTGLTAAPAAAGSLDLAGAGAGQGLTATASTSAVPGSALTSGSAGLSSMGGGTGLTVGGVGAGGDMGLLDYGKAGLNFLKDNPWAGQLLGGLVGAAAGKDTTTTASKDPWGPAQPFLLENLKRNAAMQNYYMENPFSAEQKSAYQGLLNTNANGLANAGNYAQIANNFMQSNRGQMPTMPGLLTGQTAAPVNWAAYSNIGKKA